MAHPQRNTIRARLDLHILAPAPQTPDVVLDLGLETIVEILNRPVLSGRALEAGHAFADPKLVTKKLPTPTARGRKGLSHRPDEIGILPGLVPLDYHWTRNPLTVADTLAVTLNSGDLPLDLQIIRGTQVRGWLYGHEEPRACEPGQPGYFAGVVDVVEKRRNDGRISFECRDYTIFPLNHTVSARTLSQVDLSEALPQIVEFLIHNVPGAEQWRVEGRGKVAQFAAPKSFLAEERIQLVRKRQRTVTTTLQPASDYQLAESPVTLLGYTSVNAVPFGTQVVVEARGSTASSDPVDQSSYLRNKKSVEAVAIQKRVKITSVATNWLKAVTRETITPGKMRTKRIPPSAQTVFGSSSTNTWSAIVRLCTLMGCLPEVVSWSDGSIGIVIVAADEIQGGELLRPFQRTIEGVRLRHRVLVDGEDAETLEERRELEAGSRVDFVELVATDPDTGRTRRARYGRAGIESAADITDPRARKGYVIKKRGDKDWSELTPQRRKATARRRSHGVTNTRGMFMAAHGITNQAHLERLAETSWRSLLGGEFKLTVESAVPWSNGGGPDDADLVGLASGAAVELRFRGLEAVAPERTGPSPRGDSKRVQVNSVAFLSRFYQAQGVPADAARVFALATISKPLSLVFQVLGVSHSFSGTGDGSYTCMIRLQAFLSDGEEPDLDETAWRDANDLAYQDEQPEEDPT